MALRLGVPCGASIRLIVAQQSYKQQKRWGGKAKAPHKAALLELQSNGPYNVDSISNPQASRRASGMYLEFLFRRAHSRKRVVRVYSARGSVDFLTLCS